MQGWVGTSHMGKDIQGKGTSVQSSRVLEDQTVSRNFKLLNLTAGEGWRRRWWAVFRHGYQRTGRVGSLLWSCQCHLGMMERVVRKGEPWTQSQFGKVVLVDNGLKLQDMRPLTIVKGRRGKLLRNVEERSICWVWCHQSTKWSCAALRCRLAHLNLPAPLETSLARHRGCPTRAGRNLCYASKIKS